MPIRLGSTIMNQLRLGTVAVKRVNLGTVQVWANEVVVVVGNTSNLVLKSLFTTAQWNDAFLKKRVVIPAGVAVIAASISSMAIAPTDNASGQAGSWAGDLTLEVRGTISGAGGQPNSGQGGTAIWANFPGKSGQKLMVNVFAGAIIRGGGGGGGRSGAGGNGFFDYNFREPASGWTSRYFVQDWVGWRVSVDQDPQDRDVYTVSVGWWGQIWASTPTRVPSEAYNITEVTVNGWTYLRGPLWNSSMYEVARQQTRREWTTGGPARSGGRGQGSDGALTSGLAGAAGGQNAGASGRSGDGGGWGANGGAGSPGAAGNNGSGTAGATGGLAGFYLDGRANVTLTNNGTVQGRIQ